MQQKRIAIVNQKGGVGKTTTAVHIAAGLAEKGKKVCLIDMDPQANASSYLGYDDDLNNEYLTISDLILDYANHREIKPSRAIQYNPSINVYYVASNVTLSSAELMLMTCMARERVLQNVLKNEIFKEFDYIILDCLPSLGILMINALVASTDMIIPVQCQKFAYKALDQLGETISVVRDSLNENLKVLGILATMYNHTNMSKAVIDALKERYEKLLFKTSISQLTEVVTSSYSGMPLTMVKDSRVGAQYNNVVDEIIERYEEVEYE